MKYLRNRPFLCVERLYVPSKDAKTHIAGWRNEETIQSQVKVSFVDRIRDVTKYTVIIDIINNEIIKNTSGLNDDTTIVGYVGEYHEEIKQAIGVWVKKVGASEAAAMLAEAAQHIAQRDGPMIDDEVADADNSN